MGKWRRTYFPRLFKTHHSQPDHGLPSTCTERLKSWGIQKTGFNLPSGLFPITILHRHQLRNSSTWCLQITASILFNYTVLWVSMHGCVHAKLLQSCPTLCDPVGCSPLGSSVHGESPGKNMGMGCRNLLQGIFLSQGLNPHLLRLLQWQVGSLTTTATVKPLHARQSINVNPNEPCKNFFTSFLNAV